MSSSLYYADQGLVVTIASAKLHYQIAFACIARHFKWLTPFKTPYGSILKVTIISGDKSDVVERSVATVVL